jgi:HK97 family phage major capsid protein
MAERRELFDESAHVRHVDVGCMARPLWTSLPRSEPGHMLAGSPIFIASQMLDIAPGATPIAHGNWKQTYMIVDRKAVTMPVDPYSAGLCTIFKFEARVGGATTCLNAARLLRVR